MYAFLRWLMRTVTRGYLVGLWRLEGLENLPRSGAVLV